MKYTTPSATHNRLEHLPISLFATVMGLAGLTIATEKVSQLWGIGDHWSMGLTAVTSLVYTMIFTAYGLKWFHYPAAVRHEFHNPIRLSFFPASSIGMILLGVTYLPYNTTVAFYLWAIGSAAQLIFTLIILSHWMHHERFQIQHSNPAWFIPMVGNILVPVAGVELGFTEVSWFFYSIGLIMWLPLFAVLLNRFFFYPMLPEKLLPTLFILIAPPAVGFLSWVALHHDIVDDTARILYYFALFITLLLIVQAKYFINLSFALPWWAYSFPVAAISMATMVMSTHSNNGNLFHWLGLTLYSALVLLLILLVYKTIQAMLAGKICAPE